MTARGRAADQQLSSNVVEALRSSRRRIVIVGAGGWLGSATCELLHNALGPDFTARVRCFGSSRRTLRLRGFEVEQAPLTELALLAPTPSVVLHLAFLTKDRADKMDPAAYVAANAALSATVRDALDAIGATGVFVASSGAAYAADAPDAAPAMRLYGELKRLDEEVFVGWAEARGASAVIARIFNIAGPYINKHQNYALASFILDALAERAITVRAPHRVVRGYVAIRELMSLVLALLLSNEQHGVVRFDTGGEPAELGEVASAVAGILNAVAVERAALTSPHEDRYVGDRATYDRLLLREGIALIPFAEQVRDTADYLALK